MKNRKKKRNSSHQKQKQTNNTLTEVVIAQRLLHLIQAAPGTCGVQIVEFPQFASTLG